MSTLYDVKTIEFTGRKPSKAQVMRAAGAAIEKGHKMLDIRWGENWLELSFHDGNREWYGYGWIKDISGDDLARELNLIRKIAQNQVAAEMIKSGRLVIMNLGIQ